MELSNAEKLAIAQAFLKSVGEMVETGNPENLRGKVDEEMKRLYESSPLAGSSFDVKLFGRKVGTYSLTVSKPSPSRTHMELEIEDKDAFYKWAIENDCYTVSLPMATAMFLRDGVIPNGCKPIEVVEPGVVGGEVTRTTLRINEKEVARVLGPQLEPVAQLLLEGGLNDRVQEFEA